MVVSFGVVGMRDDRITRGCVSHFVGLFAGGEGAVTCSKESFREREALGAGKTSRVGFVTYGFGGSG